MEPGVRMTDLARLLVDHPRFQPVRGLVLTDGTVVVSADKPEGGGFQRVTVTGGKARGWVQWRTALHVTSALPDLDDHATQGVLLGMLREVCGDGEVCARSDELEPMHYVDACWGDTVHDCGGYPTLGEALARALLAAWGES